TIAHRNGALEVSAHWCTDRVASLKQVRIVLCNRGTAPLSLRVAGIFEWLMGSRRVDRQTVRTAAAPLPGSVAGVDVLFATQNDNQGGFGGGTAVVWLQDSQGQTWLTDWTCDRRELFDGAGRAVLPHRLGERTGAGLDPCAALSASFELTAGATTQWTFVIGWAPSLDAARTLAADAAGTDSKTREDAARSQWRSLLSAVQVHTPDPLFNALTNGWLCYQSLACRLWARAGFYQAGGAFGFRDQLQDVMALALLDPKLLRAQMLLSASRQFIEGDVQHWWHPPEGAGVRTRCSDDLLWLPLAAVRYVQLTGDAAVLAESVPFLDGAPVPDNAQDAYYVPTVSAQVATLYEHCARAIDRSLAVGPHGLPLIGSGDWNDGMNRIGDKGQGESVWLGWFLCHVVEGMAPLGEAQGDAERAARWRAAAEGWGQALRGAAWDGAWFTRAFFDDGTPLGTHAAQECRIDLIAQAWSVLSGVATSEQQSSAMDSAYRWLTDEAHGLTRLLDPPLVDMQPSAGYIQAYPPGVRENGGQYSHGVVWWLMAQAKMGDATGAWRTFCGLSPAHRAADPVQAAIYGLEPYVMAADIYTQPPWTGRGGWSWYTGSAAWMYRAALETFLGLSVQGDAVRFDARLPPHWPTATVVLRRGAAEHRFTLCSDVAGPEATSARAGGAYVLAPGEWLTLPAQAHSGGYLVVVAIPARSGHSA
ncbi:MAG: GH36-type glycosyl hydrolase domain-containing protein, partial [Giesbergeria sp.]